MADEEDNPIFKAPMHLFKPIPEEVRLTVITEFALLELLILRLMQNYKLVLVPETVQALAQLKGPIVIVSVVGKRAIHRPSLTNSHPLTEPHFTHTTLQHAVHSSTLHMNNCYKRYPHTHSAHMHGPQPSPKTPRTLTHLHPDYARMSTCSFLLVLIVSGTQRGGKSTLLNLLHSRKTRYSTTPQLHYPPTNVPKDNPTTIEHNYGTCTVPTTT